MRFMNARNDLQSLAAAPVFSDFPARVNGLRFRVDQAEFHAKIAGEAMIRQRSDELGMIAKRLTPIGLSAKVSENHKRLALMEQRAQTAASGVTTGRQRDLEKAMAKLDALSPLSVLTRGYSITQKMNGEIVRNAHQTSAGEEISIRLSRGALRAEVLEVDDQAGAL
jgi:exodeoxyribonuclease VII large subunit